MLHKTALISAWRNFLVAGKGAGKRSGFSLAEILAAVGIMSVMAGIGAFSYLKYYEKSKLFKIYKTGTNFATAVKICLMKYHDDPIKCASYRRLKFKCDYCFDNNVYYILKSDPANKSPGLGDRFNISMVLEPYRGEFVYRTSPSHGNPNLAVRIQEVGGTSLKWCSYPGTAGVIKMPIRKCVNNSDCETGEHCLSNSMPNWSTWGTTWGKVGPP